MADLNMEAERAAPELAPCPFCGQSDHAQHLPTCWFLLRDIGASRARLAAAWNRRAAPVVGDDGLPPLPEPLRFAQWTGGEVFAYTAEQVRQAQRDAIAADRAARAQQQAQGIGDDPEFLELLSDYATSTFTEFGAREKKAALITHIDGRTAGIGETK